MRRGLAGLGLLTAACSGVGSGPPPGFERFAIDATPGAETYPVVGAVVLLDRGHLRFVVDPGRGAPLARLRRYRRIKVLRPEALELKRIEIPFDAGSAIVDLQAQQIDPSGSTHWITEIGEVTGSDGRRAKAIKLPKLEAGSVIEYTYDHFFKDPRFVPPWIFQGPLPVMRAEFAVVAPHGFEIDYRFLEGGVPVPHPPEQFEVDEGTRLSWSLADLPAQFPEPEMPDPERDAPQVHPLFVGATIRGHRFEGFRSWDDVRKWFFDERVGNWSRLQPAQAAEAQRIAGDAPLEERALKLLEVVARDLPWPTGPRQPLYRADTPAAESVLLSRQGNATSRGMLLCALLKAAGIEARPAFYAERTRGMLLPDFAIVRHVDGIAAVISRSDGLLILDPSSLVASIDVPPAKLAGTRIVVLGADGAEVAQIPLPAPADSRAMIGYDLKLEASGTIAGTMEARLTGALAGELRALLLSEQPSRYPEIVGAFLARQGAILGAEGVSIADLSELRRPLIAKASIAFSGALKDQGEGATLPLGTLAGVAGPSAAERRRRPLLLGAPREIEVAVTLLLPDDHKIGATPPPTDQRWAGGRYEITARAETPHRLGVRAKAEFTASELTPAEYPAYRRLRETLEQMLKTEVPISRPPAKTFRY